jgi:hypothetical protein
MAYLTSTILDSVLGASKVAALVAPSASASTTTASLIGLATAEVESALSIGGYTGGIPSTVYLSDASNCPKIIQLATFGAWLELAYGRNDLEIPESYRAYIAKIEDIRAGKIEIPTVARSTARAVGGVSTTESSTDVTIDNGSRPQIFNRRTLQGY